MVGETDKKDKKETRTIVIAMIVLLVVVGVVIVILAPAAAEIFATYFSPGVGLRDAAIIAFFVTIITLVVFAIAAGDGFIGEIQFMLGAFFGFFVIAWFMIAWIF
jgi:hypothetical protein